MNYKNLLKVAREKEINPHDLMIANEVEYSIDCVLQNDEKEKAEKMDFNKICGRVHEVYYKDEKCRPIWALAQATVNLIVRNCDVKDEVYNVSKWDIYAEADEIIQ